MLQNIRDNSQGWIAKTIIGLIVVLMALTGFEAIFQAATHRQDAAKVNGDTISQAELSQAVDTGRRQLMQRMGKDFDPARLDEKMLREAALKQLIDQKLLLQGAADAKFAFSETALDQLILQMPQFQVDGKFNAERFDAVIRQMGYGRMQFREVLGQDMLVNQLRIGMVNSSFVTDQQVDAFARLENQTRDFASLTFKTNPAAVQVSDAEVKAHYDQHAKEFMTPDQVVIDYIELKKSAFFDQVSVNPEELKAEYEKQIANLAEQRRAAHILIEVNDKTDDAQAKARIEEIQQRLAKGEDFAKLAKEFSQDPGSAASGGDLGLAGPGVYDPAFEEALYKLSKDQVSAPVRTEYGYHLIKLLGVEAPEVPSFASLEGKLTHELKTQQVEQKFVEVTKQLEDSAFEASDLAQPAQELGLKVHTSSAFGREGGDGITANRAVVQAAFSEEVLNEGANSTALELDPETVVVLRVKEHRKPEQLALETVAQNIRDHLAKEKATAELKVKADKLIAGLRDGSIAAGSAQDGQQWKVLEAVTRDQEGIDPTELQAAFRMAKPASKDKSVYSSVVLQDGSLAVLQLKGVNEGAAASDDEKQQIRQYLASRTGQEDFAAYRKYLEEKADITRY
ncbi:SurA N-terminal domain-containing protein [Pseudomonas sp. S75]|uniref:SurA N-terminal domain-containing protein n=1 Tax=unclassified Pseudomonas TaxID=196821 RepID=UPI00190665FE|nr:MULTISPECIES: SurA N-terminal domain-containing protein [unclassified Pseudomonas]MBJ9977288.1 SurA N-terminal domain-containing protein [Pseudomonas sp. S30]MBK0155471.1 SurA N-terminal domain-containing protein [Pseudomonas sp. S75]